MRKYRHSAAVGLGDVPRAFTRARLFGVALRSQPVDAAGPLRPFIDVGFARKPLRCSEFRPPDSGPQFASRPPRMRFSLKMTRGFTPWAEYEPSGLCRQARKRSALFKPARGRTVVVPTRGPRPATPKTR